MNSVRRIATNTVTLAVAEIVSKLSLFFLFVYIARFLGNVLFGRFNFAYSFALIAVVFIDIGINYMIVREIARKKESTGDYIINAIYIKIMTSVVVFFFIYSIINFLQYPEQTKILVYLLSIFIFIRSLTELLFSVFKAHEKMHYEASIKSIGMILLFVVGLASLILGYGIISLALIFVIIEALVFIISFIIVFTRFAKLNLKLDIGISKELVVKALPFTLSLISGAIYFNIANVILSLVQGDVAVGTYSAAYNLTMAILFIPGMYSFAIYPIFSKDFKSDKKKVIFIYERSFKYLYLIGLPISVGAFLLARKIILFIYGQDYGTSIIALQILTWYVFIKFIGYLTGVLLSAIYKQHLRMYAQITTGITNLVLNLVLIPKYGVIGACIATVISELILAVMTYTFVSKTFHFLNMIPLLLRPLIASLVMAAAIIFLNLNLFLSIVIGAAVYFVLLILMKSFDNRDFTLLRSLIKNE